MIGTTQAFFLLWVVWLTPVIGQPPQPHRTCPESLGRVGNSEVVIPLGERSAKYSSKEIDAYVFAEGRLGVKLIRYVPKDASQRPYVVKVYTRTWPGSEVKFETELAGLVFLEQAVSRLGETDRKRLPTFEIAHAEDLRPKRFAMKLPDLRGRDLAEVLNDKTLSPELRDSLLHEFARAARNLGETIRLQAGIQNFDSEVVALWRTEPIHRMWFKTGDGTNMRLLISPSQVVLVGDPAGEHTMVLIDPH